VEVQALVAPSELEQPRRVVSGLDRNRLALVLAILGRHGKIRTGGSDVFVNVVGGVRVDEPGCDLAVALAVASASRGIPLQGTPRACFGELGLTGELRWVGHPERRLEEAAKHGLHGVIAPPESGVTACEVTTLRQALAAALPGGPSAGRTRSRGERGGSPVALVGESEDAPGPRILRPAPELDARERAQLVAAGEEWDDPSPP
jgi:DNA repair protein RadA/Sms